MSELEYDVAVAYRTYPKVSKVPPIYNDDKYKLSDLCLKTFKDSLGSLKVKMFALLDNCPPEYEELFKKHFDETDLELIKLNGVGNRATFDMQVKILLEQNFSEIVYFAEDDYVYTPKKFESMIQLMKKNKEVDFISPYDHPGYYTMYIHQYDSSIKCFDDRHWRTVATTCLTFLTTKTKLKKTKKVFKTYTKGNMDVGIWLSLTKRQVFNPSTFFKQLLGKNNTEQFEKYIIVSSWYFCWWQILFGKRWKLWVPIPSIATHMEINYLAPTFDWLRDPIEVQKFLKFNMSH